MPGNNLKQGLISYQGIIQRTNVIYIKQDTHIPYLIKKPNEVHSVNWLSRHLFALGTALFYRRNWSVWHHRANRNNNNNGGPDQTLQTYVTIIKITNHGGQGVNMALKSGL